MKLFCSLSLLFLFLLSAEVSTDVARSRLYCAKRNWILFNAANEPNFCYGGVGPISRSELQVKCAEHNAIPLNIDNIEVGVQVIRTMVTIDPKYYGTWVDATQQNGRYLWSDGRRVASPLKWCTGARRIQPNVVLVCPAPRYDIFATTTCCISDRTDSTPFATICRADPEIDTCQITNNRKLIPSKFTSLRTESLPATITSNAARKDECCNRCLDDSQCAAFNFDKTAVQCEFFKENQEFNEIEAVVDVATIQSNFDSGVKFSKFART